MKFASLCTTFACLSLFSGSALGQDAGAQRQARERWFLRARADSSVRRRLLQRKAQSASRPIAQAISNSDGWTPIGPLPLASDPTGLSQQDYGMIAGRVTAIAVDPNDQTGNTVYVGGAFGGVWKSSNAASPLASDVSWQPLTDDQETLAIGAIAVQPRNLQGVAGTVVLAGTGETNSAIDSYYGLGILRSTDHGAHWSLISQDKSGHSFVGLGFSKIVFSKADPNFVVAAAAGTSQGGIDGLPVTANLGIYFSNDGGGTWDRAAIRDGGTPVAPASVTSLVYNDFLDTFFAAVRFHGFYKLGTNNAWLRLASQPGDTQLDSAACPATGSPDCPIYRGELAGVPGRNEIYAWYVDPNNTDMGISRSMDGGASWPAMVDTAISACGDQSGCGTEDGSYNLTLAAVPDGLNPGQTDIYAGAVNVYKCRSVGLTSDCSGGDGRPFMNLTHSTGCPAQAAVTRVHPAQHGIDFLQVAGNTRVVMYFATDGGVYRSLDGYSGLNSGSCETGNDFDNLNQRLGSLAQFISLAQHPVDANILLGGTPGAGFPATAQALLDSEWQNLNSSGGGYAAIDPSNPDNWFTANDASSIQQCPFGIACRTSDFSSRQVVTSTILGGDVGPPYTPFLLDPADPGAMIVGTCRIWHGQTDGSGFAPVSVNFETGSNAGCSGLETNQVRALAAFQVGSFPEIIYAATDGFGPLVTAGPVGGHVWVSDPTDSNIWVNRTGPVNPKHFPVSAVAIDPFDIATDPTTGTAGQAAYVALTGYGSGGHLWKTVNGGITWKNFDGFNLTKLPDVPVNAVVIDTPPAGVLYVGTDQGVYVSKTNDVLGASWTLVGGGLGRKLPNVPVMALQIFNDGTTKLLRAATYGRGAWQFVLSTAVDFQVAVAAPTQIVLAGQTAHFAGRLTTINGYSNAVHLSCTPSPCTVTPSQITEDGAFDVAASGAGDPAFVLHAVGTDSKPIVHDVSLKLHTVDYVLSSPSPNALSVRRGNSSAPSSFQVTASGSFAGPVTLSCLNLPAAATCSFSPSSSVKPAAGSPVAVSVSVTTATTTPTGVYSIGVDAAAFGGHRQAPLSLTVVANPDYKLDVANASLAADVGTAATFELTVTSLDNYITPVSLSCGIGAPPTCSIVPSLVTPTPNGAPVRVSVQSSQAATYDFTISGTSTDSPPVNHSIGLSFTSLSTIFDFTVVNTSGPLTVRAGESAVFALSVTPQPPATVFPASVTLNPCTGVPNLSTCAVSPSQFPGGGGARTVTVTVTTTAPVLASVKHVGWMYAVCLAGLPLLLTTRRRRSKRSSVAFMAAMLMGATLVSCGGGLSGGGGGVGLPGTAPDDYQVGISVTCSGATRPVTLNLKVT